MKNYLFKYFYRKAIIALLPHRKTHVSIHAYLRFAVEQALYGILR